MYNVMERSSPPLIDCHHKNSVFFPRVSFGQNANLGPHIRRTSTCIIPQYIPHYSKIVPQPLNKILQYLEYSSTGVLQQDLSSRIESVASTVIEYNISIITFNTSTYDVGIYSSYCSRNTILPSMSSLITLISYDVYPNVKCTTATTMVL